MALGCENIPFIEQLKLQFPKIVTKDKHSSCTMLDVGLRLTEPEKTKQKKGGLLFYLQVSIYLAHLTATNPKKIQKAQKDESIVDSCQIAINGCSRNLFCAEDVNLLYPC